MKFLETITCLDNDLLVPIDKIRYISKTYQNSNWKINIYVDDKLHAEENFGNNEDKAIFRYNQIKKIISAK